VVQATETGTLRFPVLFLAFLYIFFLLAIFLLISYGILVYSKGCRILALLKLSEAYTIAEFVKDIIEVRDLIYTTFIL